MTTETTNDTAQPRRRRGLFAMIALALVSLFAVSAAFAGGPGRHAMHKKFAEDPEAAAAFVAAKLANHADASDEQEDAFRDTLEDLFVEMAPLRADKEAFRQDVKDALTAETIDGDALEQLRAEGIKRADEASVLITEALTELASELTPEQRLALADEMEQMRERWHR
ncbi:MAG: periplasmic heavy metal sensor [Deltaproteobacteria bacterium]|nr:periplasmic heavy metal sensor [Deltaproteobacteria bacterium]